MKKINIIGLIITFCLIFISCDNDVEDPAGIRGVAVIPIITDVNPAIFDSKNLATTYIKFVVSLESGKQATSAKILASYNDSLYRVEIASINSFPATITIAAKDVAEKLGIDIGSIVNGDVFKFELLVTANGVTTRSASIIDASVACAFDPSLTTGSYHVVSKDWQTAGNVTLTADPADPYTIYVKGLATIDGVTEDKGPLVMHINKLSYAVTVDKTVIASSAFGYTNEAFAGSGTYGSCDGSFEMNFTISVDAGTYGTFLYSFTKN
jgi:hypothetical protein